MKCPNCGGEVSVNDLVCPYCGSPNPEGAAFHEEVQKRRKFNEYIKEKVRKQMRLPLAHRIMNLSILILLLLFLLLTVISLGFCLIQDTHVFGLGIPRDIETQMEQLYKEGHYGELYALINEYNVEGRDYPEYMQMCLLHYDYEDFLRFSMACTEALEKGTIPDSYYLEYAVQNAADLLRPDIPAYPDIYPENEKVLKSYQTEVSCFLIGTLHLTQEEIDGLWDSYDYVSYTALNGLLDRLETQLRKEGYHAAE